MFPYGSQYLVRHLVTRDLKSVPSYYVHVDL